ncbi:MAG: hypothetical protein O2820_13030 [Planctomycetota bacterium]|mgnify:CR=1 FL=1|nr:hypothetical protein [Planctomycetota bacterium]MDA1250136.1 hypothetical protein [Planctomycetota bacterium]
MRVLATVAALTIIATTLPASAADQSVNYPKLGVVRTTQTYKTVCEVKGYAGQQHGFFNFNRKNEYFRLTTEAADRFLVKHGFLKNAPTIKELEETIRSGK